MISFLEGTGHISQKLRICCQKCNKMRMKQSVLCMPSHLTCLYLINPPNTENEPGFQSPRNAWYIKAEHQQFSRAFFALLCNESQPNETAPNRISSFSFFGTMLYESSSQSGVLLSLRAHLVLFEDIFNCHNVGGQQCYRYLLDGGQG